MNNTKITFIGAGNMAKALVAGLIQNGHASDCIWVSNPSETKLHYFADALKVKTTRDNKQAAKQAEVLVLSVKPAIVKQVCEELVEIVRENKPLIISIATGIQTDNMSQWLRYTGAIIRAMPNTPASVGAGATGLFANTATTAVQRSQAETLFRSVGIIAWFEDEALIRAVIAVSGSSPAYVFLLMEAMTTAAIDMGLDPDTATLFTSQSVLGAAKLALTEGNDFESLRHAVTSPNGTTQAALDVFAKHDFKDIIAEAMQAALKRAIELSKGDA